MRNSELTERLIITEQTLMGGVGSQYDFDSGVILVDGEEYHN
jgi:hypothetical protein